MASPRKIASKMKSKVRALARLLLVAARFVLHPADFLRLYYRESHVADSALDVALITLEDEFTSRLAALEARVAELEHGTVAPDGPR